MYQKKRICKESRDRMLQKHVRRAFFQGTMQTITKRVGDLIYPPRCPFCDGLRAFGSEGICEACSKKVKYIREPRCMKCGKQLSREEQEYCGDCGKKRHFFISGRALYDYGTAASAIYRFKYRGRREYGEVFGEEAAWYMGDYIRRLHPDGIVPVPMYEAKQRRRGYNQAEVLAKAIGRQLGIQVMPDLVKRTRNTKALKTLNPKERLNNLKNAFILVGNGVKLNTIIIVDDIYTTGSTVDAVARVLLDAGVENVYFIALAIGEGI